MMVLPVFRKATCFWVKLGSQIFRNIRPCLPALCACILLQIFYYNSAKHLDKPSGSSDEPANSNYQQLVQYAIYSMFFLTVRYKIRKRTCLHNEILHDLISHNISMYTPFTQCFALGLNL